MRKLIILYCSLLLIGLNPKLAFAHLAGQPPFFRINNIYSGFYPVYVTSLKNFVLPQDTAPKNYLINQSLNFDIDATMLPFPQTIIDKTTFSWDFGDGTKAEGLQAAHTYTKIGSYLLTINANYGGYSDPNTKPLLQAILVNIVPDKAYILPKAIIKINGQEITDPTKPVSISSNEISLDATSSKNGSAKIVSYFWDEGDGVSTTESIFHHAFTDPNEVYIFPMLRVRDSNGFINDTYVQLEKTPLKTTSSLIQNEIKTYLPIIVIVILNIVLISGVIIFLKKR